MDKKNQLSIQALITEVELSSDVELSYSEAYKKAIQLRKKKLAELKTHAK